MPSAVTSVPASWYTDPAIFSLERDRIFRNHWWLVARSEQLAQAGTCIATRAAIWPIVLSRTADGRLCGFHNVCRHRAGPLMNEGESRQNGFVCQYHGWRYDGEGHLVFTPALKNGEEFSYEACSLYPIHVAEWNGMVFACPGDLPPDLLEWLGDIVKIAARFPALQQLSYHGEARNEGDVNWKAYGDNSCEGYHVGMVHKSLGQAMGEEIDIRAYENGQFVGFDVTYQPTEADPTRTGKGFWVYKFPATLLHFSDYAFNAETVRPLAADKVEIVRWFWIDHEHAAQNDIEPDDVIASSDQVMDEDMGICRRVQANLASGVYESGLVSISQEPGTVYFQQLVKQALGNAVGE